MLADVTLAQIAALLAVAQDHALGQPPGAQLRATVLGQRLATAAGVGPAERATTWRTSALRFLGCTGHAFDMAVVFVTRSRCAPERRGWTSPTRSTSCG